MCPGPAAEQKPQPEPEAIASSGPVLVSGPRVPDFRGKAMVAVMRESASLGIPVEIVGTGIARDQTPAPGGILPAGVKIHVQFARPQ